MYTFLLITFCSASALASSLNKPCKVSDSSCLENFLNTVQKEVGNGIPELGIMNSDPLFIKKIEGNLSIIKYKIFNSTLVGYKGCVISNVKINEDITSLKYDLNCQRLSLKGKYEINGRLIVLPIEGKGDYRIVAKKYLVHVESDLKKVEGAEGKTHLSIEKNILKAIPQDIITYHLDNLFNGQKDLANLVHKYANENWREVAELLQDPIWYNICNKLTNSMNKYLLNIPLEDVIRNYVNVNLE